MSPSHASSADDVAAAIGAGYQRHLAKPVSGSELVRVAAALCGRDAAAVAR